MMSLEVSIGTYLLLSVDKFGDKVVEEKKYNNLEEHVSPYLRRPLRSLADALAARKPLKATAARTPTAKVQSLKQPAFRAADENHPQT